MEMHGRPRKVVLDFDGAHNERELARITMFRLGVPWRLLDKDPQEPL